MPDMTVVEPISRLHRPIDPALSEQILVNRQSNMNINPDERSDDDLESGSFDEKASIRAGDVKFRQEFRGLTLFWLAFQSIGTVYGDIGTSPLYVYSSTFATPPGKDELLCAASLIIWALAFAVTLKYCLVVLYADDAGEGGTFALYSLLARYARIEDREPGKAHKELDRHPTMNMAGPNKKVRAFFESSRAFKLSVRLAAIFGVCCVMADGVFTPAQSVLGAIQGVRVYNPSLGTNAIIGITAGILVLLFAAQPLGINRLATGYAPIVAFWLLFNLACGIYNLARFDVGILQAFYPYYAFKWFWVKGSWEGFHRLGGILLCFTGVEALFADMGAFSRKAIQLSWLCFAWPCLTFAYLGQEHFSNPFFLTLPPGCFWPGLISSVLAAIVASQAMITASFQILSQAMSLCYFPRIRIKFTSTVVHGQCYVPLANWLLMIGCVIVVGVFNNTTSLGNAYGLCVILVTMVTTCLAALVATVVWRFNPFFVVLPAFLIFFTWDCLFLSISVFKIPDGAYVTVLIACVLSAIMIVWRAGKSLQWKAEAELLDQLHAEVDVTAKVSRYIDGVGIFFDETDDKTPPIYSYWLRSFQARHAVLLFVHLRQTYHPTVADEDRYTVDFVKEIPNAYRILLRYGYNEPQKAISAASGLIDAVAAFLDGQHRSTLEGSKDATRARESFQILFNARHAKEPVYMFGRKVFQNQYNGKEERYAGAVRGFTVWAYATIRDVMTSKPRLWDLPPNRVVEIGKAVLI